MKCWHCCIDISKKKRKDKEKDKDKDNCSIFKIPINIDIHDNIICIGHCCCINCSLAYIISSNTIYDISLSIQLLYNMYQMKNILPSPMKELLKDFGGTMTYEEYHKNHIEHYTNTLLPPFLPLDSFNTENIKIIDYNVSNKIRKNNQLIDLTYQEKDSKKVIFKKEKTIE